MTRMPETPGIKMSGLSMTSWYPLYISTLMPVESPTPFQIGRNR